MSNFSNHINQDDLIAANYFHYNRALTGLQNLRLWAIIAILFSALHAILFWSIIANAPKLFLTILTPIVTGFLFSIAMALVCALLSWLIIPYQSRKLWNQSAEIKKPSAWSMEPATLSVSSDSGIYHIRLDEIHKWAEHSGYFLLYVNDMQFRLVSKREMTLEQQSELRANLQTAGCPVASFMNS